MWKWIWGESGAATKEHYGPTGSASACASTSGKVIVSVMSATGAPWLSQFGEIPRELGHQPFRCWIGARQTAGSGFFPCKRQHASHNHSAAVSTIAIARKMHSRIPAADFALFGHCACP
jgi:hypothetical protein